MPTYTKQVNNLDCYMKNYYINKLYQSYLETNIRILYLLNYTGLFKVTPKYGIEHISLEEFKLIYVKDKELVLKCINSRIARLGF